MRAGVGHGLVQSVNALLQGLEQVLQLQAHFIADAAHQLKTPVAGLKAHIELLARQPDAPVSHVRTTARRARPGKAQPNSLVAMPATWRPWKRAMPSSCSLGWRSPWPPAMVEAP